MADTDTSTAAAENWVAWLDDLPIEIEFHGGIEYIQEFIIAITHERDAALARAEQAEGYLGDMRQAVWHANDHADQAMAERAARQATIAALTARVAELEGALIWCSGSSDFNEGGIAREGWQKICAPLLFTMQDPTAAIAAALAGEKGE